MQLDGCPPGVLREKTMDFLLIYFPFMINIARQTLDKNYWLESLDTSSLVPTNQNSIIVPKVYELNN